jgi:hypothetical protein
MQQRQLIQSRRIIRHIYRQTQSSPLKELAGAVKFTQNSFFFIFEGIKLLSLFLHENLVILNRGLKYLKV